jgi:hypothetical protein
VGLLPLRVVLLQFHLPTSFSFQTNNTLEVSGFVLPVDGPTESSTLLLSGCDDLISLHSQGKLANLIEVKAKV